MDPLSNNSYYHDASEASSSRSPPTPLPTSPLPSYRGHQAATDAVDLLGSDDEDGLDGALKGYGRTAVGAGRQINEQTNAGELGSSENPLNAPVSFKRRQKQSAGGLLEQASRLLSSSSSSYPDRDATREELPLHPTARQSPNPNASAPPPLGIPGGSSARKSPAGVSPGIDWYAEGPGRRVGYEDLTAIDWIFETNRERQRRRALAAGAGHGSGRAAVLGHLRRLLDAGQVWVVLVLTGIAAGALAAAIDVASDWLGDIKTGYCTEGGTDGGAFYLNRPFCCMGYDDGAQCAGWRPWGTALHARGAAGKWFVQYLFYVVLSVSFAASAAFLVKEYAVYAKHSGIPEIKTMLAGFVMRRFLGAWTLVTKSLGLCLAVSSGMWLGKEGPLVHVACCCANLFIKLFPSLNRNEARKREVLSAASASGISVAFGSPIGGVLFSLETLSYYFPEKTMWQSFVCAMTAAFVLQALDPFRSGKLVLYQVKYTTGWHAFEVVPFMLLGILGGVYGGLFIKANMWVAHWKKAHQHWLPGPIVQVTVVALLTALINYPDIYMRAQSSELVSNLFTECSPQLEDPFGLCKTGAATAGTIVLLLFAAAAAFLLAAITFGLQIPAGIILPSMAIGALVGRAVGIVMEIWQTNHPQFIAFQTCEPDLPCVTPGTYAIVGAAAALAGVTRVTVSIVVIVFELTGALTYVLPIMVAVMLSKWVGDAFSRRGIYEAWIHFNEYPYLDNSDELPVPDIPSSRIMTRIEDLVVLTATGHTVASLQRILAAHPFRGFPVISDPRDALLLGYISRAELAYTLRAATQPPRSMPPEDTEAFFAHQPLADPRTTLDLRPWMDQTPLTLPSHSSLHLTLSYFRKLGLRYVLFSDRGSLQGILTKKDVWYVLHGAEEARRSGGGGGGRGDDIDAAGDIDGHGPASTADGTGRLREDGVGERRGLLGDSVDELPSPGAEQEPIL